jgi:predicted transcriptional regulator
MNQDLDTGAQKETPRSRWGEALDAGFQVVPDVLLRKQQELGLTPTDVVVLLNLTLHWWYQESSKPCPKTSSIALRMGVDTRTVQRSFKKLEDLGFLKRVKAHRNKHGKAIPRAFDMSQLVHKMKLAAKNDKFFKPASGVEAAANL